MQSSGSEIFSLLFLLGGADFLAWRNWADVCSVFSDRFSVDSVSPFRWILCRRFSVVYFCGVFGEGADTNFPRVIPKGPFWGIYGLFSVK